MKRAYPQLSPERYKAALRSQLFCWANGYSYHCPVSDECCPDFSCCFPDMKVEDQEARWKHYRDEIAKENQ